MLSYEMGHPVPSFIEPNHMTTTKQDRDAANAARNAERAAEAKAYAAKRFGLNPDDIIGYNAGICYDKIWVKTREAANKVAAAVKGDTVNGGMFHGMAKGGIDTSIDKDITLFEVIC